MQITINPAQQSEQWIEITKIALPIVGTLGGVIIGGALAYFSKRLELKSQNQREDVKLFLSKVEETHSLIVLQIINCNNFATEVVDLFGGNYNRRKFLELQNPIITNKPKLLSMMHIYLPELRSSFGSFADATRNLQIVAKDAATSPVLDDEAKKTEIQKAAEAVDNKGHQLLAQIQRKFRRKSLRNNGHRLFGKIQGKFRRKSLKNK